MQPIIVSFQVAGIDQVNRAFRSVEDAILRSERSQTAIALRGAAERTRSAQTEAQRREREFAKLSKDAEKWVKEEQKAAEKAEKEKTRATEKEGRERARLFNQEAKEAERAQRAAIRQFESSEAEKTRIAEQANRKRQEFARTIAGAAGQGVRAGIGRVAGITGSIASTALQLGGGFSIADSMQRSVSAAGMAADIANSGFNPNSKIAFNQQQHTGKEISAAAGAVGAEYGMDKQEVLGGLQKFVGITGDLKGGMDTMKGIAEIARATGSSFDDVAAAAGNVAAVLPETADRGDKVMAVMRGIAGQGKMGAVEMRDLATQMAKIVAASGKFEGDNVDNILKLGALAQQARGGGGAWNAASATTAVNSFTATFGKGARRKEFAARGIDIEGEGGKVRDPFAIIADSIEKTKGNTKDLNDLFGSVMSDRAIAKSVQTYRDAESAKKGSGKQAVTDELVRMASKSTMSEADVKKAAAQRMQEDDAKMAQTRAQFDAAINTELMPEFMKLIPVVKDMVPVFVDLAKTALPEFVDLIKQIAAFAKDHKGLIEDVAKHPIGAIIAASVASSIAQAGVGAGIKAALEAAIKGSSGGGVGAGGIGGAGAGIAAAGVGVILASKAGVDAGLEGQAGGQMEKGSLDWLEKHGTPEQKAAAAKRRQQAGERSSGAKGAIRMAADASMLGFSLINEAAGGKNFAADDIRKTMQEREVGANTDQRPGIGASAAIGAIPLIGEAIVAIKDLTAATKNAKGGPSLPGARGGEGSRDTPMSQRNGGTQ